MPRIAAIAATGEVISIGRNVWQARKSWRMLRRVAITEKTRGNRMPCVFWRKPSGQHAKVPWACSRFSVQRP
ncbi:hypothetical protein SBBP2_1100005 [Burkholderiales bacterium]|nr:hypothetical protein SBBP2_1100005 [Burkholderiales bacterium]